MRANGRVRPDHPHPPLRPLQEVPGRFDGLGAMNTSSKVYWQTLEVQLEASSEVKHMFESTW